MTIQIDKSLFLPKLNTFAGKHKPKFKENSLSLGEEVLDSAQHFFDDEPWKGQPRNYWETQRDCRLEMKRYIMQKIDIESRDKSYFVPTFVWVWLAKLVINYIIKLIIEHYWSDLQKEIGIDY